MKPYKKQKKKKDKNEFSRDKKSGKLKTKKHEGNVSLKLENHKQKKLFYFILILMPILFFVLLEAGLRLFNYGYNYNQWIEIVEGKLILNPDIAHKYFHLTKNVPISNQDVFDKVKKDNSFRIFVLGGSSGAGYPYTPNGSFSRYLKDRLILAYPNSTIEVINCSMTAINSYALRDFVPEILKQKPDLILIYAGHNEYYGALGIGSMESLGTSRAVINFVIGLEKFRTFQLVRDIINNAIGFFSDGKEASSGTLMSRMAQNQYIKLGSEVYQKGLSQFKGNMEDILEMAKDAEAPVILGTLTSNLKDQYPFVSISSGKYPPAEKIFTEAKKQLANNNIEKADSLFSFAKDLDALRFRAPSQINNIIFELGKKYNIAVLNIDSAFKAISPDHIVGDNLMSDHLHPTLNGYHIMGRLFFERMKKLNYLPQTKKRNLSGEIQDSIVTANFNFSELDSVIAFYRIELLKNDWPFRKKGSPLPASDILKPETPIDSIAFKLMNDEIIWEEAHRKAAAYYLEKKDITSFLNEINVLISQYPIIGEYYEFAVNALLPIKDYETALKYLEKGYEIKSTAFNTKWIGTISLYTGRLDSAKAFLNESLRLDNKDPQVWYNLAGVYVNNKNYEEALDAVNHAVSLKNDYTEALALKNQLKKALK